jgi:hypothetical protein
MTGTGINKMTHSCEYDALQLSKVPRGLNRVLYGLILTALVSPLYVILITFPILFGAAPLSVMGMGRALYPNPFAYIILYSGTILSLYGVLLCLSAPREMAGRKAIFVAAISGVLAHVIGLATHYIMELGEVPVLLAMLPDFLLLAAFVCFLLFLQQLGQFIHDDELISKSKGLLKLGIFLIVIVSFCLSMQSVPQLVYINLSFSDDVAVFLALLTMMLQPVAVLLGLIGLIRYLGLVLGFKKKLKLR